MKKTNKIIALVMSVTLLFSSFGIISTASTEDNVKKHYMIADTHLDTVWLWDLETTITEFLRNTLTGGEESSTKIHPGNLTLMEKYPEYRFSFEGAYRYELIKEYYPEEWEKIKAFVANGQWNTAGAFYENGDVTAVSPETLIRNILYGNQFFADTFGNDSRTKDMYLPDAFGFTAALPSVGAHTNLDAFTTFKLTAMRSALDGSEAELVNSGKQQINYPGAGMGNVKAYLPFTSGVGAWQGVDGNSVIASIHNNGGYASKLSLGIDLHDNSWFSANKNAYDWNAKINIFGNGDRGGSPTEESVLAVLAEMEKNTDTSKVFMATTDEWVMDLTEAQLTAMKNSAYAGDLLLNEHGTGSYTARAMSHRLNSQNEILAAAAENASVAADWFGTAAYPQDKLTEAWKRVIAHTFHDDITGTSYRTVYERSWNELMVSLKQFAAEYENALGSIASLMDTSGAFGTAVVVNNPVGTARNDVVTAELNMDSDVKFVRVYESDGAEVPSGIIKREGSKITVAFKASVPSMGYKVYNVVSSDTASDIHSGLSVTEKTLQNDKYLITLNENGDISSIYDKILEKELLASPVVLGIFDDTEGDGSETAVTGKEEWPAWEIRLTDYADKTHKDYVKDSTPSITIEENSNARVAVRVVREYKNSKFDQLIILEAGDAPVKVENNIDWHENSTLLKAVFDLTASNENATYDLGLGAIERSTNTEIRGEVPAQKWADITNSDGSYGISVLSDCKNGWDKPDDSTLRLTLIHTPYAVNSWASSTWNDFEQSAIDFGANKFSFAIASHSGAVGDGDTQKQARLFTENMTAVQTVSHEGVLGSEYSFASLNNDDIIIRAMKKAEVGTGLDTTDNEYIVRFNEGSGKAANDVVFTMGGGIASVRPVYGSEETITDETGLSEYRLDNGKLIFDMSKYEIRSFAVTLNAPETLGTADSITKVDISAMYNTDMISSNESKNDETLGFSFPSELLPENVTVGGVEFGFGSRVDGANNAIRADGQSITLPSGTNKAYILAFSLDGDRRVSFGVGDGAKKVVVGDARSNIASFEMYKLNGGDFNDVVKVTDSYIKEQDVGFMSTHRHENGADVPAGSTYLFKYEFDIPEGVSTLVLPKDENIVVAAVSAENEKYASVMATSLMDSIPVDEANIIDESLIYSVKTQNNANIGEAFTVMVKTSTKSDKITFSDALTGAEYKLISSAYRDSGNERTWSISFKLMASGERLIKTTAVDTLNGVSESCEWSITLN